jgi:hypothetical protein
MLLPLDGDTLGVFDFLNRRLTIVSPELRTLRTVPANLMPAGVLPLDGRQFIATGLVRSPDHIGYAVHVVKIDPDGLQVQRSFGGSGEIPSPTSGGAEIAWYITPSIGGRFWTSERLAYRIALWDDAGRQHLVLERGPSWFRPQKTVWMGDAKTPPNPLGAGVSEQGGILWTFTHVPDQSWQRAWPSIPSREAETKGPDIAEVVDTMIEAIDIASGRVLARIRIPQRVVNSLPGGRLVTFDHDANGEARLELHTLRIKR